MHAHINVVFPVESISKRANLFCIRILNTIDSSPYFTAWKIFFPNLYGMVLSKTLCSIIYLIVNFMSFNFDKMSKTLYLNFNFRVFFFSLRIMEGFFNNFRYFGNSFLCPYYSCYLVSESIRVNYFTRKPVVSTNSLCVSYKGF